MSNYANQTRKSSPTSSRDEIQGAGATYRASVQKESRTRSSTTPAKTGSDTETVEGEGSIPTNNPEKRAPSVNDGHYAPR